MELAGKVFVVTGGGSGIGRQLVLRLLQRGAIVAAVDINPDALRVTQEMVAPNADKLSVHQVDISDRSAVAQLVQNVIQQHSQVDAIINNAGVIHPFKPVNELQYAAIDKVFSVNLHGVINLTKEFLPLLLNRPTAHITNISSMGGLFAFPKQTFYGASKAAVKLISEGLYAELKGTNVGVTVVFPGAINTDITRNSDSHDDKLDRFNRERLSTSPETAALKIVEAIEQNRFSLHIGLDAKLLGFLYRMLPKTTVRLLSRIMKIAIPD